MVKRNQQAALTGSTSPGSAVQVDAEDGDVPSQTAPVVLACTPPYKENTSSSCPPILTGAALAQIPSSYPPIAALGSARGGAKKSVSYASTPVDQLSINTPRGFSSGLQSKAPKGLRRNPSAPSLDANEASDSISAGWGSGLTGGARRKASRNPNAPDSPLIGASGSDATLEARLLSRHLSASPSSSSSRTRGVSDSITPNRLSPTSISGVTSCCESNRRQRRRSEGGCSQSPSVPAAARNKNPFAMALVGLFVWAKSLVVRCWALAVYVIQRLSFGRKSFVAKYTVQNATSWREWFAVARERDNSKGYKAWSHDLSGSEEVFDATGVQNFIDTIEAMAADNSGSASPEEKRQILALKQLSELRKFINRNTFGITNPRLYNKYASGTKSIVRKYVEICSRIIQDSVACGASSDGSPLVASPLSPASQQMRANRRDILRTLVHSKTLYGSTALLLNGSIALGAYHLGIVRGLIETSCLPRVIFGSNTGAIVAAYLCCKGAKSFDPASLDFSAFAAKEKLKGSSSRRRVQRLWREGTIMDVSVLQAFVKANVGEMTFMEAYQHTGLVLNIQVLHDDGKGDPPSVWLLNHLSAPNVLIHSAAVRSCATKGVYKAVDLLCKASNGKILRFDIPAYSFSNTKHQLHVKGKAPVHAAIERMRQLFNIRMFIVCESTIYHLPFVRLGHRDGLIPQFLHFFAEEVWRGVAFLSRRWPFKGIFTNTLQSMSSRYPQPHILLQPVTSLSDLMMLARNPDGAWLRECEQRSMVKLWPRIVEISTHVRLEAVLQQAIADFIKQNPNLKESLASFSNVWENEN